MEPLEPRTLLSAAPGSLLISYNSLNNTGMVGEFSETGATINATFINGLNHPEAIAIGGANIFVADSGDGSIIETNIAGQNADTVVGDLDGPYGVAVSSTNLFIDDYNSSQIDLYNTAGGAITTPLITTPQSQGPYSPIWIAVSGSDIFAAESNYNTINSTGSRISEYTTSGGIVDNTLVQNLTFPTGFALSGDDLFVADKSGIGEYTTSGQVVNADLIPNVTGALAVDGNNLFVVSASGTVGEYTLSGAVENASLVTGLANATAITILSPTPTITENPVGESVSFGGVATFSAAADDPTDFVQWQISNDGGATFANLPGANSATYQFTPSLGNNGAIYQAVFTNSQGVAAASGPAQLLVTAPPVPTVPTSLSASQGSLPNHVNLTWAPVSDAFSYQVFRGTSADNETKIAANITIAGYNDVSAVPGQVYFYSVRAVNSTGLSPNSDSVTGFKPLSAPQNPTASDNEGGQVSLTWNAVANADTYQVFRSTQNDFNTATKIAAGLLDDGYVDTTAITGQFYFYWIRARNPGDVGIQSVVAGGEAV